MVEKVGKEPRSTVVEIDIKTWIEEAERAEVDFLHEDELVDDNVRHQRTPMESGRLAVAARHIGRAPVDILPPNELLLNAGAADEFSHKVRAKHRRVMINGKPVTVRSFIGNTGKDPGAAGYISTLEQEAADRAARYLLERVPGHVENHLRIMADRGRPLAVVAQELIDKILSSVSRLEGEGA